MSVVGVSSTRDHPRDTQNKHVFQFFHPSSSPPLVTFRNHTRRDTAASSSSKLGNLRRPSVQLRTQTPQVAIPTPRKCKAQQRNYQSPSLCPCLPNQISSTNLPRLIHVHMRTPPHKQGEDSHIRNPNRRFPKTSQYPGQ